MPRTFAHYAQGEGKEKEKGRQGKEGRLLPLLSQQSKKKKSINKIVTIFKMKKAKRHSTLTQSRHKTQSWFELTVNHKTNLRLKLKKKKKEQNEEQWGSPSFVCEPAWLGFSTCISLLLFLFFFTALKQVDDKNINLSRLIVWHAYFDTLPSQALYSIITHSYSLPDAAWMNTGSKGSCRTSVHCCCVLLL